MLKATKEYVKELWYLILYDIIILIILLFVIFFTDCCGYEITCSWHEYFTR